MSDSGAISAEDPVSEDHDVSSAETSDGSSPITPDITTDVAPTRRAKRRPEPKAAEPQEAPKVEEQPAQVNIKYGHHTTKEMSLSCLFVCPHSSSSFRHPLCLREAGATGAAGENQSYPQQQLLWPLWVSKTFLFV